MVVFLHIGWQFTYIANGNNEIFFNLHEFCKYTFKMFFMASFFIIHGFLHKNRSIKDNFIRGARTLLIPMLFLHPSNKQWFCWAMFFAIILYDILHSKLSNKFLFFACLVLAYCSVILKTKLIFDKLFIDYALLLIPFIFLGQKCKNIINNNLSGIFGLIVCSLVSIFYYYNKTYPPQLSGTMFHVNVYDFPLYVFVSVCGASAVLLCAKMIEGNKLVSFIGRNSLFIFLFHFYLLKIISLSVTKKLLERNDCNLLASIGLYILLFLFVLSISCMVAKLVNKYCPYVLGKWNV